ncbi:hypothetical protein ETD85_30515 [Nonomuraea zeae]|uniref:Uncharacterized protein n=1 Tax=Nonomuraea zeae TaxID=1642303 RepID=A0A5S4GAI7_9ACTN|nr:hypothetical protein ETD85_30515 [Nonomuraea zeae]
MGRAARCGGRGRGRAARGRSAALRAHVGRRRRPRGHARPRRPPAGGDTRAGASLHRVLRSLFRTSEPVEASCPVRRFGVR